MKITYLVDRPNSHGHMPILAHDDFLFHMNALENYLMFPNAWREVGKVDRHGDILGLSAPPDVHHELSTTDLDAGSTFTFDITEAESEAVKLRDILDRIVGDALDAFGTEEEVSTVSTALIEEARKLLYPD